jgi:allophanate hydrolase
MGVPEPGHLRFFGQDEYPQLFRRAVDDLEAMGGEKVEIPFDDFADTARLLYEGPWVAERWAAFGEMIEKRPDAVLPVIRKVVEPGKALTAADAFRAQYRLDGLKARCQARLAEVDVLVVPTAGTHYRLSEVAADPIGCNSRLGAYTNFVNLLDLCALAVPGGFQANGLPFGVTLIGLPFREGWLASLGSALHRRARVPLGATGHPLPEGEDVHLPADRASLAVAGLHLSGQPLNGQLTGLGARLRCPARTAPVYRLYALRRGERHFPGLVRQDVGGAALAVEIWEMSRPALGLFLRQVKAPLAIGTVELESGEAVPGFLCESYATSRDAEDITRYGGWLAYKHALEGG